MVQCWMHIVRCFFCKAVYYYLFFVSAAELSKVAKYIVDFASAAVTLDSSHMTVSSSTSWSRFSLPSNFVKSLCWQCGSWSGAILRILYIWQPSLLELWRPGWDVMPLCLLRLVVWRIEEGAGQHRLGSCSFCSWIRSAGGVSGLARMTGWLTRLTGSRRERWCLLPIRLL